MTDPMHRNASAVPRPESVMNKNGAPKAVACCPRIASFATILRMSGFARGAMSSAERAWDERI